MTLCPRPADDEDQTKPPPGAATAAPTPEAALATQFQELIAVGMPPGMPERIAERMRAKFAAEGDAENATLAANLADTLRTARGATWNYGYNILDVGHVLNTGEQPLPEHPILWCGGPFTLRRVILGSVGRAAVVEVCSRLRVLCVADDDGQRAQAGDLWAGISPTEGWGELADEIAWARRVEAEDKRFPALLEQLILEGARSK